MNFQDASNLRIPEGYVRTIHDKNNRLLWGSVWYNVSFDGNATQGELPSQYRQVEYVEATGTQYVNTGVSIASAGAQWSATVDIQYTAVAPSSQIMLGTGTSAGGWAGQNGGLYALGPTIRMTYASTQRAQAYVTFGTSASITIESKTITRAGSVPSGSVYLLAAANGDFASEAKLYSCKIYDASNVLVRDFVPCVRKSDSVAGLYDMVSMAFYASNGADAFSSGPNLPTPSTPVPTKTVQGEQNILVTGKNLIYTNPRTNEGITFSYNSTNGATAISGTPTLTYAISATNSVSIPAGTYTLSIDSPKTFNIGIGTRNASNVRTPTYIPAGSTSVTITRTEPVVGYDIYVSGLTSGTYISDEFKLMLEQGSTATSYEPYQSQSYTISLGSIELCKIGDYQDYMYKSGDDWYVYKAINKVILNGSEAWSMYPGRDGTFYITKSDIMLAPSISATPDVISDYYEPKPFISLYNMIVDYGVANHNAQRWIAIRNKDYSDVSSFKTWLASNNTTVYYVLATPANTKITDNTLIDQLNAAHQWATRYGYNTTVSGDLPIVLRRDSLQ